MMRELDTVSPVVWPAWCYTGNVHIKTHSLSIFFLFFSFRIRGFGRSNGKGHESVEMEKNGVIFSFTFHFVIQDNHPSYVYLVLG